MDITRFVLVSSLTLVLSLCVQTSLNEFSRIIIKLKAIRGFAILSIRALSYCTVTIKRDTVGELWCRKFEFFLNQSAFHFR